MDKPTKNIDHNLDLVAFVRSAHNQYQAGLTTEKELAAQMRTVAESPISIIYAVGDDCHGGLTYGTVDIKDLDKDPALVITSRCGDSVRIDKNALLNFKRAVNAALSVIEKRYPSVGQL